MANPPGRKTTIVAGDFGLLQSRIERGTGQVTSISEQRFCGRERCACQGRVGGLVGDNRKKERRAYIKEGAGAEGNFGEKGVRVEKIEAAANCAEPVHYRDFNTVEDEAQGGKVSLAQGKKRVPLKKHVDNKRQLVP